MDINWRPITDKSFEIKIGMFLYSGKYIYLVGHITSYDRINNNRLAIFYESELGNAVDVNSVTHYINPEDLTDEQIAFLYKQSLES